MRVGYQIPNNNLIKGIVLSRKTPRWKCVISGEMAKDLVLSKKSDTSILRKMR